MAIVKNNFRVSRLKGEFLDSPRSRDNNKENNKENSMSSDEDELQKQSSENSFDDDEDDEDGEEDEDDEDADSGMGSDDVDLSELGEVGEELCQVGNQICSVPFELYDLSSLSDVLSVDVWNDCLSEEERFGLAKYLPDMDQEAFLRTMKELFEGENFHFGSPLVKLFDMLKGGLCEPRVMLYQHGWNFFQKFRHYHDLRNYQNSMVGKFVQISNAWLGCKGYGIEERLRVLNLMGQKSLMYDKREDMAEESDSSGREEFGDGLWTRKLKDAKHGSKLGHQGMYMGSPTMDPSLVQNPKGLLKLAGSRASSEENLLNSYPSAHGGMDLKSRPISAVPRKELLSGYDVGVVRQGAVVKGGMQKLVKGHEFSKNKDGFASDPLIGVPLSQFRNDALRKNWNGNQMAEMKYDRGSIDYSPRDAGKKAKYLDKNQHTLVDERTYNARGRVQPPLLRVNHADGLSGNQNYRHIRVKEEAIDHQVNTEDWDGRGDSWKMRPQLRTNKNNVGSDPRVKSYRSLPQVNDMFTASGHRSTKSGKKIKRDSVQNGLDFEDLSQSDETESDSSEEVDEEEGTNPFRSDGHGKLNKVPKKEKAYISTPPGAIYSSKTLNDDLGERLQPRHAEIYAMRGKQKGKTRDPRLLHNYATGIPEESGFSGLTKTGGDDGKRAYRSVATDNVPLYKAYPSAKKKKGFADHDYHAPHSNYAHGYMEEDADLHVAPSSTYLNDSMRTGRMGRRGQTYEGYATDRHEGTSMPLLECSSSSKKRKGKVDVAHTSGLGESSMYGSPQQLDDPSSLRKRGRRELEAENDSFATPSSEKGLMDVDPDTKPGKKPFTLITPSIHTDFSFSIIHLLSAVRVAMVTPLAEDGSDIGNHIEQNGTVNGKPRSHDVMNASTLEQTGGKNLPCLTVQEIVNRVKSNPGDPCILETQEPLQDLVRGVLKIFSSKTAPLGAKGWKALVSYEKSTKSWSWVGPVSSSSQDSDTVEEVTSFEAWGLPHKMLVKLVDAFANWLKNGQETLQQIGSLPAPPLALMQPNLDEKDRFRDLRAQKSLTTITPSSEEVRAYFRREEILRYSVPDRAFSYTAADGRKSIVAPLRRGGGKPTSKARDHPILKPDRPPHVTILCLVRDAAARLPGSIGTRADVCALIRDSQYIVEDVTDVQVNQVVSGALDRLHYERDPCVQFDSERKLWVYLHRDREEEDFEDDGTSSTKKWKRPRKDAAEQSDSAAVNVTYSVTTSEQVSGSRDAAYAVTSDFNVKPPSRHPGQRVDQSYQGLRLNEDENTGQFVGFERGRSHQVQLMDWEGLGLSSLQENNLRCQENARNEDYDDDDDDDDEEEEDFSRRNGGVT